MEEKYYTNFKQRNIYLNSKKMKIVSYKNIL